MYIYTNIACRRLDVRFLKVINKEGYFLKNEQHINLKDEYIYFPPYKTQEGIKISLKYHKPFLVKINKLELHKNNNIYDSIKSNKDNQKQINSSGKAFGVYIKNIFKKYYNVDLNVQKLRRLCASAEIIENKNIIESVDNSNKMSHTITTHNKIYQQIK